MEQKRVAKKTIELLQKIASHAGAAMDYFASMDTGSLLYARNPGMVFDPGRRARLEQAYELRREYFRLRNLAKRQYITMRKRGQKLELTLTERGEQLLAGMSLDEGLPDGQMCVVVFDIPEAARKARDVFRYFLRQVGFTCVQLSVWKTEKNVLDETRHVIRELEIEDWVQVFVGKNVNLISRSRNRIHIPPDRRKRRKAGMARRLAD